MVKEVLRENPRFDLSPFSPEDDGAKRMYLNFISNDSPSETNADLTGLLRAVVFYDKTMPVGMLSKRSGVPVETIATLFAAPMPHITVNVDPNEEMWVRMDPEIKTYLRRKQKVARKQQTLEERARRELERLRKARLKKEAVIVDLAAAAD